MTHDADSKESSQGDGFVHRTTLVLAGTIICAIKPKKRKGRRMRRRKSRRMSWSHHSQRQDDKEVLE